MKKEYSQDIDTLFYDGSCPLCSREIKKLSELRRGSLDFKDIHTLDSSGNFPSKSQLLKKLHLKTQDGWITGLDANIQIWQQTSYAWAWQILRLPIIYPFASSLYDLWAKLRYERRYSQLP